MELASFWAQHPPVSGLLDEGVPEPVGRLGSVWHLLQEARAGELL